MLVAAYIANIGEGHKFTKLELHQAVPDFSQVDRRMRDPCECGWVIDNYKVNPSLKPNEYLVQKIGARIDLGERPPTPVRKTISGTKRRKILELAGNLCAICGVPEGGTYPDLPGRRAVLTVGQIASDDRFGPDDDSNLQAECQRCNTEVRDNTANPPRWESVLEHAQDIGTRADKARLLTWMIAQRRIPDDIERIFAEWRRLPRDDQDRVMADFSNQVLASIEG
ncbi:HNH endonuclease [Rhodococcus sp. (in: high G+C Gram-positive bacteria)]|uniref:HNH endonuclease n=1 Tax=Rhodococcus sp. TaxID=1831 RepID=UPI00257D821F|nr:HNH endonuclease [Rhodococcus sp. (in: high G+C Gram-positive bacteria)]